MKLFSWVAAVGATAALLAGPPSQNLQRVAEISAWLPPEPGFPQVRCANRVFWDFLAKQDAGAPFHLKKAVNILDEPVVAPDDSCYEQIYPWNRPSAKIAEKLRIFTLAECLEGKGRFLPKTIECLEKKCAQTTWMNPYHDRNGFGNFHGKYRSTDLDTAANAEAVALALDQLRGLLPEAQVRQAEEALWRNCFSNYLAKAEGRLNGLNGWFFGDANWNVACHGWCVSAALRAIPDRETRARFVEAAERGYPHYLNGFSADGYCHEGMDYWNFGYGMFLMLGWNVRAATGGRVDFFAHPMAKKDFLYAFESQLRMGVAPRFGDGTAGAPGTENLALAAMIWPDTLTPQAAKAGRMIGRLSSLPYRALHMMDGCAATTNDYRHPIRSWFPDAQTLVCRPVEATADSLAACIRGGHNACPHNHNDIGQFVISVGPVAVVEDPAGAVYTLDTFTSRRYNSPMLNSFSHAVPRVEGALQQPGRKYASRVAGTSFTDVRDELTLDITGAYAVTNLSSLVRRFTYDRRAGAVQIEDDARFARPGRFESPISTYGRVVAGADADSFVVVCAKNGKEGRLALRVDTHGAKWHVEEESIPNPKRQSPTRWAVVLDEPTAHAVVTFRFTAIGADISRPEAEKSGVTLARETFEHYSREICGEVPERTAFAIDASLDAAHDEYRVTFAEGGARFTGANTRALLFAVYDFLSRRCGCRWYWDGDVVPKAASIDLSGPDIREKSRFEYRAIRYFAHRGLTRFQAEHWGLEDWKREIDWCVKNRINTFMMRIGQDDLFQKAFPEVCPYPDAALPSPESRGFGRGYNDRSLFWPLQYRGELRRQVLAYARARGLMAPEDFGTMSHWYSRTPYAFLDKMKPAFLPQQGGYYGHPTDRVWDIRDPQWLDAYWKLTQAAIDHYGSPELLHTIGIAERHCFTNRADNLKMKVDMLNLLVRNALDHYPKSKILFAGWDFYNSWKPDEVPQLLKTLDSRTTLIWDYEADAHDKTNFTEWNIIGRFPYTFGIFLTLEQGLDVRADYGRITSRQRLIADDPMCRGYIFWPESSHTDQLCLNYFVANCWKADKPDVDALLADLCRGRYADEAAQMERAWKLTLPISTNCCDTWRDNCGRASIRYCLNPKTIEGASAKSVDPKTLAGAPAVFRTLAEVAWTVPFVRRDSVDLARTVADRLLLSLMGKPQENAARIVPLMQAFTDLLALHGDYSLAESYDRLAAIHPIAYPGFSRTLVGNAVNGYCASHHYEAFAHLYLPWWRHLAVTGKTIPSAEAQAGFDRPLKDMRPTLPRTPENYRRTMLALAQAAEESLR